MKKRFFYLVLIMVIAVLAFSACTAKPADTDGEDKTPDKKEEKEPDKKEEDKTPETAELDPYELVYYMYSTKASDQDSVIEEAINAIIQPKFNATVDFVMVAGGDWDEKAKVPLNSGEKIDIFWTPEWMGYMDNITAGVLLPLEDLLDEYAPQTKIDLGDFVPANVVDGHLYGVATNKELTVPGGFIWNQDLVEKYNIDITKVMTPEDLDPILADFKGTDEYKDGMFPLLSAGAWTPFDPYVQGFMADMSSVGIPIGEEGGNDGEPVNTWTDTTKYGGKERREIMAKWNKEKYLHPDSELSSFTNIDFLNSGQFLVSLDFVLKGGQVKAQELMAQSGNSSLRLVEQQTLASVNVTTHAGGSMLGIPITSEDPARAMMYINEMHQNVELLNIMAWGVEGVHYDKEGDFVAPKENNGWSDSHGGMWTLGNQFKQYLSVGEDPDKYGQMLDLTAHSWAHESLGFRFKREGVAEEYTAIKAVTTEWERALNTGNRVDEYDTFVKALEDAGINKVLDEAKAQYADWKASK